MRNMHLHPTAGADQTPRPDINTVTWDTRADATSGLALVRNVIRNMLKLRDATLFEFA